MNRELVADLLHEGFVGAEGTRLRDEDRVKTEELVALLAELERTCARVSRRSELVLVDAAAGKGYVGLLAAKLLIEPQQRSGHIHLIERDPRRLELARRAAERLRIALPITYTAADVDDASAYPRDASVVVALHACGDATDRVLERACAARARNLLVVPCCVGKSTRGAALARSLADAIALPTAAPIRRRMVHAVVDGERLLGLEAAGYQTEAVEIFPARVSPYNVALRARRVEEPRRSERARVDLDTLRAAAARGMPPHHDGS